MQKQSALRNNSNCWCAYIIYITVNLLCAYIWVEAHAYLQVHAPKSTTIVVKKTSQKAIGAYSLLVIL